MRPLGDIMFGPRAANFPVSLTQGCRIVTFGTVKYLRSHLEILMPWCVTACDQLNKK